MNNRFGKFFSFEECQNDDHNFKKLKTSIVFNIKKVNNKNKSKLQKEEMNNRNRKKEDVEMENKKIFVIEKEHRSDEKIERE